MKKKFWYYYAYFVVVVGLFAWIICIVYPPKDSLTVFIVGLGVFSVGLVCGIGPSNFGKKGSHSKDENKEKD